MKVDGLSNWVNMLSNMLCYGNTADSCVCVFSGWNNKRFTKNKLKSDREKWVPVYLCTQYLSNMAHWHICVYLSIMLTTLTSATLTSLKRREKRGWVWNQFFVLEEYAEEKPLYVGKVWWTPTSAIHSKEARKYPASTLTSNHTK